MSSGRAKWINGKRQVTGSWNYNWPSDTFTIILDQKDRITGENKVIITHNDIPEWGNWIREGSSCPIFPQYKKEQ